jgi:hypothetical protein
MEILVKEIAETVVKLIKEQKLIEKSVEEYLNSHYRVKCHAIKQPKEEKAEEDDEEINPEEFCKKLLPNFKALGIDLEEQDVEADEYLDICDNIKQNCYNIKLAISDISYYYLETFKNCDEGFEYQKEYLKIVKDKLRYIENDLLSHVILFRRDTHFS